MITTRGVVCPRDVCSARTRGRVRARIARTLAPLSRISRIDDAPRVAPVMSTLVPSSENSWGAGMSGVGSVAVGVVSVVAIAIKSSVKVGGNGLRNSESRVCVCARKPAGTRDSGFGLRRGSGYLSYATARGHGGAHTSTVRQCISVWTCEAWGRSEHQMAHWGCG